jgi:hypothetical protein
MSKESEDAAKWAIVSDYKKKKEEFHNLRGQLSRWGQLCMDIGSQLQNRPFELEQSSLAEWPTSEDVRSALAQLETTERFLEQTKRDLLGLGIEPF